MDDSAGINLNHRLKLFGPFDVIISELIKSPIAAKTIHATIHTTYAATTSDSISGQNIVLNTTAVSQFRSDAVMQLGCGKALNRIANAAEQTSQHSAADHPPRAVNHNTRKTILAIFSGYIARDIGFDN